MQIIGFDAYNECLTKIVKFEVVEHSGIEHNCWHYEQTFESGVPAGAYLQINCGDQRMIKPLRIFEVEFYDTTKRIILAENRQAIWKKFEGNVYAINRIEIT